jgi:hypothetical protein
MLVILEKKLLGFDQNALDDFYARYDDPQENLVDFSEDDFVAKLEEVKAYLLEMERKNKAITHFAKAFGSFYTLWSVVALEQSHLSRIGKTKHFFSPRRRWVRQWERRACRGPYAAGRC